MTTPNPTPNNDSQPVAPPLMMGIAVRPSGPPLSPEEQRAARLLNQVQVASPCNESWDAMPGGDQVRSCARCQHKVYNLSEMTALEAARLIEAAEGRLCIRFYRRTDGTLMTKDCPTGARLKRQRVARAGGIGFTALAVACGAGLAAKPRSEQPPFLRWVMSKINPEPVPAAVAGGMSFRPLPMASPTPQPVATPTPVPPQPTMGAPMPIMGEAPMIKDLPKPRPLMGRIRVVPRAESETMGKPAVPTHGNPDK